MSYNHCYKKKAEEEKSGEKYPIMVGGRMLELSSEKIGILIKKRLQSDLAVQKLCDEFEVSLENLMENLTIEIKDLSGVYAETDLQSMTLDKGLFDGGKFFSENYFVCVHELAHLLSRIKENSAYFNDPEEVIGFVGSIASLLVSGSSLDQIWSLVYPKISFHFHNEEDSRKFMVRCIYKAKEILG